MPEGRRLRGQAKTGEGEGKIQASSEGNKWHHLGNIVNDSIIASYVTDGWYTCGERSMRYKLVESLGCTPDINVTFCVNYTQIKKN